MSVWPYLQKVCNLFFLIIKYRKLLLRKKVIQNLAFCLGREEIEGGRSGSVNVTLLHTDLDISCIVILVSLGVFHLLVVILKAAQKSLKLQFNLC